MIKGDRRKNIPNNVVSVWAESGWVLESPPETKPVTTPPEPAPTAKSTPEKK